MTDADLLTTALRRILAPLVRVMLAHGMRWPAAADLVRDLFVAVADRDFALAGRRMTDSRLALLTGVQRREVRALRDRGPRGPAGAGPDAPPPDAPPANAGPLPRVIARWQAPPFADADGPRPLSRDGFAALVAGISRDMHARTLLDELLRLGMVTQADDALVLRVQSFVPSADAAALLHYFGANLGDHAQAAAANLAASPAPGPFFERATHYNRLRPQDAARIEALARARLAALLADLDAAAAAAQRAAAGEADAHARLRIGAFVYREETPS